MGLEAGNGKGGGGVRKRLHSLMRRKHVDSDRVRAEEGGGRTLAKELSVPDLVAIGVGSTIGAGVYVLVGAVAREQSGPALTLSFLIAGIAAALSALCYAELASRCPSAGSAYHYSYVCIGEGVAWLIGWSLILEYTISGAAVARGLTPNLALFFGGQENLPAIFARAHIPGLDIIVDPCAALLVLIITGLLCWGIKESSSVQAIVTTANVCVMSFVIVAGGYIGFKTGWVGYKASGGYFPYGLSGMLTGSASVFFAYIGFDSVASTAEEVKNPRRDLPLGIGAAFSICCLLYMLVSVVIVGMVPYYAMDPDTPISSAFAMNDLRWAMYIVAAGTVLALCSTLLGSLLPQPRILMAMARDGLLPTLFSDVNEHTQVPVKGTILTGVFAATLAFFMDVSQLAGMVSVGTLLAFTIVAISILILRYVPPDEVCLPSSFHESIKSRSSHGYVQLDNGKEVGNNGKNQSQQGGTSLLNDEASLHFPLIVKETKEDKNEQSRRMKASCSITSVCIGILVITTLASYTFLPVYVRYSMCSLGGLLILGGLSVLSWIDQDDGRHTFGCPGGFLCPFVPLLPACSIFINAYLLVNLGGDTWMRVLVWLLIGILVYIFYGRTHSSLSEVVYLPTAHTNEIHRNFSRSSA